MRARAEALAQRAQALGLALQERAGETEGAKASYRAVLEQRPNDAGAANALRRLERYTAARRASKPTGWLSRVFARLGLGRR